MKKLNKTTRILNLKKATVSNLTARVIKNEEASFITTSRLCWETTTQVSL